MPGGGSLIASSNGRGDTEAEADVDVDLSALGQGEEDVSAFLSEIDNWFKQSQAEAATVTGAGASADADEDEDEEAGVVEDEDCDEDDAAPLAEFRSTPVIPMARRETAVAINSNEIRRAVAGTTPLGSGADTISAVARSSAAAEIATGRRAGEGGLGGARTPLASGGSAGSRDTAMLGSLLGDKGEGAGAKSGSGRGRETPTGCKAAPRSLLPSLPQGKDERRATADSAAAAAAAVGTVSSSSTTSVGLPPWLSTLTQDMYSAAYLLERARQHGSNASVQDPKRYAAGLAALANVTHLIRDAGLSSTAGGGGDDDEEGGASGGESQHSRSQRALRLTGLRRGATALVKAAATLLCHAFGGAVKPVEASR